AGDAPTPGRAALAATPPPGGHDDPGHDQRQDQPVGDLDERIDDHPREQSGHQAQHPELKPVVRQRLRRVPGFQPLVRPPPSPRPPRAHAAVRPFHLRHSPNWRALTHSARDPRPNKAVSGAPPEKYSPDPPDNSAFTSRDRTARSAFPVFDPI